MALKVRSGWGTLAAATVMCVASSVAPVGGPASAASYVKVYGYIHNSDGTVPSTGYFSGYPVNVTTQQYGFDWVTGSYHGSNGLVANFHSAPADGSYEIDDLVPGQTYRINFDNAGQPSQDQAYDLVASAGSTDARLDISLAPRFSCLNNEAAGGSRVVGQTLTAPAASSVTLNPAPPHPLVGFQWARYDSSQSAWVPIVGARDATYTLTSADQGFPVDVEVIASDGDTNDSPGGFAQCGYPAIGPTVQPAGSGPPPAPPAPVTSATPSQPALPPAVVFGHTPKLVGTPDPGHRLVPPPLPLPPNGEVTWQWFTTLGMGGRAGDRAQRGGAKPIHGAHHRTYRVRSRDRGSKIFLQITVSAPGHTTVVERSKPVRIR